MTDDDPDEFFEEFDAPEDADPFSDLADDEESGMPPPPEDDAAEDEEEADPFADFRTDAETMEGEEPFDAFPERDRSVADEDPFRTFESPDVETIDVDDLWESLSGDEDGEFVPTEDVYYEVSKHRYCERCEYFSEPPTVSCGYEGAAIVEFLDAETVRLVNCPIVAEQRELEAEGNLTQR